MKKSIASLVISSHQEKVASKFHGPGYYMVRDKEIQFGPYSTMEDAREAKRDDPDMNGCDIQRLQVALPDKTAYSQPWMDTNTN